MVLARRLLMAGGGAGSFAAPAGPVTLTSAPYGGWTQIPEARAIWFNGVIYFGYVNGSNGNVEIRSYGAGVVSAATVLHSAMDTPADSHDVPAILVRPDGYIVVAYSAHNGSTLYSRISSAAEDVSAFEAEVTVDSSGAKTYPVLIQQLAEASDPIYVWYREGTGAATTLRYSKSSDGGATWTNSGNIYVYANAYWKIVSDGQYRIDFFVTSGAPPGDSSIYHFYADDVGYHASDGTDIGDPPFGPGDVTEVYSMLDAGPAWPTDAYLDANNLPRMVYAISTDGNADSAFRFASADVDGAWTLSSIIESVGFGVVDPSPVATIDGSREDRCYLVRYIAGQHELWRYATGDGGGTWTGAAITSGSSVDNLYPVFVRGHPTGFVLWLYGDYTGAETAFDMGIKAVNA